MKKIFFLALIMLICAQLQAQETPEPVRLNPDEAVELAFRNNLSLESSRTNLETSRRASSLSWNQFIPSINMSGTINRQNEEPQGTTIPFPAPIGPQTIPGGYQWQLVGTIQASVNLNFAMFENMTRLRRDYEAGILGYEKAKAQLERDVRKAYHNILLLQANIDLLYGSFANAQRQVDMAQANYNAGLMPELTLLQARVARENLRPIIDQAENGLKLSTALFAMYLGLDYDTQFDLENVPLTIEIIPMDVTEMITKAASEKPDIRELRRTILMLESARKMQIYALTPSLLLNYNYNPVFLGDPMNDSWFGGSSSWMDRGSFSITVAVRLHSLIPFSVDYQGIKNIDDQLTAANIGLAQMINGTEIEIYNTILSLERTRISAEAMAQTISLAEQSYRLTEEAYRAGLQDYFQVQSAEQSLHQARVQMLEQQFNYLNGLIDLEYSIGVPFGTLSGRNN